MLNGAGLYIAFGEYVLDSIICALYTNRQCRMNKFFPSLMHIAHVIYYHCKISELFSRMYAKCVEGV